MSHRAQNPTCLAQSNDLNKGDGFGGFTRDLVRLLIRMHVEKQVALPSRGGAAEITPPEFLLKQSNSRRREMLRESVN